MKKLDGLTPDTVQERIEDLRKIFPEVFKDGRVDFEELMGALGEVVENPREKYSFSWAGKAEALKLMQRRSCGTLRPCKPESKNWDATQNLYVEGDNLEVLKLLQKAYQGKVKMIYIDPPYNTGNDFVYADDFADGIENYKRITGQTTRSNPETAGRFHTNWLNMMYPRLKIARTLLKDDGVIFISIDDHEQANLKKLCDEVFGEDNFLANIVWQKKYAATNDAKGFSTTHDYIVVYQKSDAFRRNLLPRTDEQNEPYRNDDGDGKGLWRSDNLLVKSFSPSCVYPIVNPNTGKEYFPPQGSCWRASKETMQIWLKENRIFFGKDGQGAPQLKRYLNEVQQGRVPQTWWTFEEAGHNDGANKEVAELFQAKTPFDTPKPTKLLLQMLRIATDRDSIILDFFSGSATTAHAVMQLNAEDGGTRKFICVQLPEVTDTDGEAYKAGFRNICEIGKERIRRAGEKIKAGSPLTTGELDVGFKVFKLDSSNLKKWDNTYTRDYEELAQRMLGHLDYLTPDRTVLDMAYELLLKYGCDLSFPVTEEVTAGVTYYVYDHMKQIKTQNAERGNEDNFDAYRLLFCMQEGVAAEQVEALAELPIGTYFFADRCFLDANDMTNADQILTGANRTLTVF